jgi:hypothetical protein
MRIVFVISPAAKARLKPALIPGNVRQTMNALRRHRPIFSSRPVAAVCPPADARVVRRQRCADH